MQSVKTWADMHGYDYEFSGDESFEVLPHWFQKKFEGMGPQLSDLARLLMAKDKLQSGYERVVWADADVLVISPESLVLPPCKDSLFGYEHWVDVDSKGKLKHWNHLHNAFMVFKKRSVVLPYLIYSIESIAERIDINEFAPQTFGPKLLGALHSISKFDVQDDVGALSPLVCRDLMNGGGQALDLFRKLQKRSPSALNLCLSLVENHDEMLDLCTLLRAEPTLVGAPE